MFRKVTALLLWTSISFATDQSNRNQERGGCECGCVGAARVPRMRLADWLVPGCAIKPKILRSIVRVVCAEAKNCGSPGLILPGALFDDFAIVR